MKLLTILIMATTLATTVNSKESYLFLKTKWGTTPEMVSKKINLKNEIKLNLIDKKAQLNPFLKYITSIDANLSKKIKILKVNGSPAQEYHFISNKLFAITQDYKNINKNEFQKLKKRLKTQFGKWEKNKNQYGTTYHFEDKNSKIIVQLKNKNKNSANCRVYLYAKKIFRILLKENL